MKSFATQTITSALLAVCLLWAQPASAAIANVQNAKTCATGFGTTCAITVTALTGGNVVYIGGVTSEAATLTVAATNVTFATIHDAVSHSSGGVTLRAYLWRGVIDTGGATTVTITANTSAVIGGWASEFSGVATSSDTDVSDTGESAGAGTSHDTCSVDTTNANDLLINVSVATSAVTWTAGSNYTLTVGAGTLRAGGEYRIVSATGTYTCPITLGASSEVVQLLTAFKATAAAASGANGSLSLLGVGN